MSRTFMRDIDVLRRYGISLKSVTKSTPAYVVNDRDYYRAGGHNPMYDRMSLDLQMYSIPTYVADGFTEDNFKTIADALEFSERPQHPTLRKAYDEYRILKQMIEGAAYEYP